MNGTFKSWVGRHVDLKLLSREIERFFRKKRFKTIITKIEKGYSVRTSPPSHATIYGVVDVKVEGKPSNFTVTFLASKHTRSAIRLGFITTFIGGGNLLLRGLKSQEALDRLEKEFWIHLEEVIGRIT